MHPTFPSLRRKYCTSMMQQLRSISISLDVNHKIFFKQVFLKHICYKRGKTCCLCCRPGYTTFLQLPERVPSHSHSLDYNQHIWVFVNFAMMNTENLTTEYLQQCTPTRRFFTEVKNQKQIGILLTQYEHRITSFQLNDFGVTERFMLVARILGKQEVNHLHEPSGFLFSTCSSAS